MKSIVVMTYYHLMHSIALALTFDEKPNLYVSMGYLNLDDEFLDRIRETEVFNSVTGITRRGELEKFWDALRKTRNATDEEIDSIGNSLFEEYLEPRYKEAFKDADFEDELYIYNDFPWHFYYIQKHFKKLVGIEDGYASLIQQISIHTHKGAAELVYPFIEKGYYPESVYKDPKFTKIISSSDYKDEELDDYYRDKLFVWDYNDIISLNSEKFRDALLHIFNLSDFNIKPNSCIVLGQPLDRAKYCDSLQNYLLTKKMIRKEIEKGYTVYFKPHPADKNDSALYSGENVVLMSKDFPVEVLNYHNQKFERLSTFSSTGASTIDFAKENVKYFNKTDTSREEVTRFIKKEIKKEKATFNYYIKVKEKSPQNYVNLYSGIFRNENIHTNIYAIFDEKDYDDYCKYYSIENYKERIKEFRDQVPKKISNAFHKELKWMEKWVSKYSPTVEFIKTDSWEDDALFGIIEKTKQPYEYIMVIESNNQLFTFTRELHNSMRARMSLGFMFPQYTEVLDKKNNDVKISIKPGYVKDAIDGRLINKVIHRSIIEEVEDGYSEDHLVSALNNHGKRIKKRYGTPLYVDPLRYLSITDAEEYYTKEIENSISKAEKDDGESKLVGEIANIIYDYYDWQAVTRSSDRSEDVFDMLDCLIEDKSLLSEIYRKLASGALYEKKLSDRGEFFQDGAVLTAIKPVAESAAESGSLIAYENIARIKSKLKRKK